MPHDPGETPREAATDPSPLTQVEPSETRPVRPPVPRAPKDPLVGRYYTPLVLPPIVSRLRRVQNHVVGRW